MPGSTPSPACWGADAAAPDGAIARYRAVESGRGRERLAHRCHLRGPHPEGIGAAAGDVAFLRGATTWASTVAAYEQLPKPLRSLVDDLWATHTNLYDYASSGASGGVSAERRAAYYTEFTSSRYETVHPVVRVHPETGERSLLLGQFVKSFQDLPSAEFASLFQLLQARITKLENTFRWNWRLGDVAMWDNRATQHYGIADFGEQQRELHRVTLAGDVPVDVYGRRSQILLGDASHYSGIETPQRLELFAA